MLLAKREDFVNPSCPLCLEVRYLNQNHDLTGWPIDTVGFIDDTGQTTGVPASINQRTFKFRQLSFETPIA